MTNACVPENVAELNAFVATTQVWDVDVINETSGKTIALFTLHTDDPLSLRTRKGIS